MPTPALRVLQGVRWFAFHTVRFMFCDVSHAFRAVAPSPPALPDELILASKAVHQGAPYEPPPLTRQRRQQLYGDNLLEVGAGQCELSLPARWLLRS